MSKTKGMKCTNMIMIDDRPYPCNKTTDIIGGYFFCHYCERYVKDPITQEAIRYE